MKLPVDLVTLLSRKGLTAGVPYKGIVVDNNDPDKLCRVQVRVPVIHDGIPDEHLPWAIPESNNHSRGLVGGNSLGRTMSLAGIPVKQSKVDVYFHSAGDPNLASYSTCMPITQDMMAEEFLNNYPDMHGKVLPSGMFYLHNERTNEVFLNLPGDAHVTIFGDCTQTIVGNHQIHVAKSTSSIPAKLKSDISSLLDALEPTTNKRVDFKGRLNKEAGNLHIEVEGDLTSTVQGSVEHSVIGDYKHIVRGNYSVEVTGSAKINGRRIDLN